MRAKTLDSIAVPPIFYIHCCVFVLFFVRPLALARHTLLQFLALALAGANCKCVWL